MDKNIDTEHKCMHAGMDPLYDHASIIDDNDM